MRIRLRPAVHGHIADSARAGQAARRIACPPIVLAIRGTVGGLPTCGRKIISGPRSGPCIAQRNPLAGAASPRDTGISRPNSRVVVVAPGSAAGISSSPDCAACRPGPRCSGLDRAVRGASACRCAPGHAISARGSPATYAVFRAGCPRMTSWQDGQTVRVLRRICAIFAAQAGWPGPGSPRLASFRTWCTSTLPASRRAHIVVRVLQRIAVMASLRITEGEMALMRERRRPAAGSVSPDVHARGEAVEEGLEAAFELAVQGGFCHRGAG
jgi:hypothetical protein